MNKEDIYHRQIKLIGKNKQELISNKTVVLVGLGGLGSPIAIYLSRIGIKKLIIVDNDVVDESNLSRQVLYDYKDIGEKKVIVAHQKLKEFCLIEKYDDIKKLNLVDVDIIIGCVDNWTTRYQLNEIALKNKIPMLDISVEGYDGHLFWVNQNHCLKCVFSKKDSKRTIPIVNTSCAFASSLALTQIFRFLIDDVIDFDKMIYFNSNSLKIDKFKIKNKKSCFCNLLD